MIIAFLLNYVNSVFTGLQNCYIN